MQILGNRDTISLISLSYYMFSFKVVLHEWYQFKAVLHVWYQLKGVLHEWYQFKGVLHVWYHLIDLLGKMRQQGCF